ncbi:hypothetical protein [Roseococcus sp.]|uniref:AbiTii domain-containing protein n=1 Tax=Roseococcus sp. TaxID=2109646 RepID=UPI003BAA974F
MGNSSEAVPLVIQLQMAAMDSSERVSSILLKAKLVASKLGMGNAEIARWIGHELDGYMGSGQELPAYRILSGHPLAMNPVRGEIPVQLAHGSPEPIRRALFELPFLNGVPEVEALITKGGVSKLRIPFPPELQQLVSEIADEDWPLRWAIGPGQLAALVEAVRSRAMQWALDLEAGGVLGAGFSFSLWERNAAVSITNNFANSNIGNIGDVTSGGQVNNNQTINNDIGIEKIIPFLNQLSPAIKLLPPEVQSALVEPIEILTAETKSKDPSQGKIRAALTSMKTTCEGAAGNLIASGILETIKSIFTN